MTTKTDIDNIFNKWERYLETRELEVEEYFPEAPNTEQFIPTYIPTPINAGPKPISIEEYKKRQERQKQNLRKVREEAATDRPRKRTRGGRQVRARQHIADLHRIIAITTDKKQKNILINKIKEERKANYGKVTK